MANFKISVEKGRNGEILIYGNYLAGNEPVKVALIEVEKEWMAGGASTDYFHVDITHNPGMTSSLYMNLGTFPDLKSVSAKAFYFEVEETSESGKVEWSEIPASKMVFEEVV